MHMYWSWSCSVFVKEQFGRIEVSKICHSAKMFAEIFIENCSHKTGNTSNKARRWEYRRIRPDSARLRANFALERLSHLPCLNYYMLWLQLLLTFIIGDCTFPIIAKSLSGPIGDVQWMRGGHCWLAGYRRRRRRSNVLTILDFKWVVLMFLSSAPLAW